jgi:hypothetical protein
MRASWSKFVAPGAGLAILVAGLFFMVTGSDEKPVAQRFSAARPPLAAVMPTSSERRVRTPLTAPAQIASGNLRAESDGKRAGDLVGDTRASLYAAFGDQSITSASRWRAMSLLLKQSGTAQGAWASDAQTVARNWAAAVDVRVVEQGCFKEGCFFFVEYGRGVDTRKLVEAMSSDPSLDWPNEMILPAPSGVRDELGNGAWFLLAPQPNG